MATPGKRKTRPNNIPSIVSGQANIFSPSKRTTPRRLFQSKGGRRTLKRRSKFKTFKKKVRTNKNKTYKKRK